MAKLARRNRSLDKRKARAASRRAARPNLDKKIKKLRLLAAEVFAPRPSREKLLGAVTRLAVEWKEKGTLKRRLTDVNVMCLTEGRSGANQYLGLIKAIYPRDLDRRTISKAAAALSDAMQLKRP